MASHRNLDAQSVKILQFTFASNGKNHISVKIEENKSINQSYSR